MKQENEKIIYNSALKAVFNNPDIGLIVLNKSGAIEAINEFMSEKLGEPQFKLEGHDFYRFLDKRNADKLKNFINQNQYNNHKTDEKLNFELRSKSGRVFDTSLSVSEPDSKSKTFYVGVFKDITPRKELKDKLKNQKELSKNYKAQFKKEEELNKLKTRFVSMASHELMSPLAGMMSSVNLIKRYINSYEEYDEKLLYKERIKKHINVLENSLKGLRNILNEFLSLGNIENGIINAHYENFNLNEFLKNHEQYVKNILKPEQKIIYQKTDCDYDIYADKIFLQQVINNLISNAIKYSANDSDIIINSMIKGNNLHISVTDYGIGIPDKEKSKIFDHFYRAENVQVQKGTGLGLTISKKYLEMMGGKLSFNSKENNGTTFKIKLPLRYETKDIDNRR